jgi:hypothetical protein
MHSPSSFVLFCYWYRYYHIGNFHLPFLYKLKSNIRGQVILINCTSREFVMTHVMWTVELLFLLTDDSSWIILWLVNCYAILFTCKFWYHHYRNIEATVPTSKAWIILCSLLWHPLIYIALRRKNTQEVQIPTHKQTHSNTPNLNKSHLHQVQRKTWHPPSHLAASRDNRTQLAKPPTPLDTTAHPLPG